MIGSFKQLKRTSEMRQISEPMRQYFNDGLPPDCSYEFVDDERTVCVLTPSDWSKLKIEGCTIKLTDEQKKILGSRVNDIDAIRRLAHNMLQPVEWELSHGTVVLPNGYKIPASQFMRTVGEPDYANKGYAFMTCDPREFETHFWRNDKELAVHFKQVASKDIDIERYESTDTALEMSLEFNDAKGAVTYNYRFVNTRVSSAVECRDAAYIFDGFIDGTTRVARKDGPFFPASNTEQAHLADNWQMVVDVQNALGIEVDTSKPMSKMTAFNIERLHECLCKHKAVGLGHKPKSIKITTEEIPPALDGKQLLTFPGKFSLTIFEVSHDVIGIVGLKGIYLGEPNKIGDEDWEYPLTYDEDFQCSVLYIPDTDIPAEEDTEQLVSTLFDSLPDGQRY